MYFGVGIPDILPIQMAISGRSPGTLLGLFPNKATWCCALRRSSRIAERAPVTELQAMLVSYPADGMRTYPVTTRVNNPRYDDQPCLAPALGTDAM